MYNRIIKPLLFSLNIEQAHRLVIWILRILGVMPGGHRLLSRCYAVEEPALKRDVFGMSFRNPIGLAAGFDRDGEVVEELGALGFGFVEVGAVTSQPQEGNPKPRVFRLHKDQAIVNRLGQPNRGWMCAIENLRKSYGKGTLIGCNISSNSFTPSNDSPKEYLKIFRSLYQYVDYFTVNIAAQSVEADVVAFSDEALRRVVMPLCDFRRGQSEYRPILIKLSPDLTDEQIDIATDVMIETPLDGIVAVTGTNHREGLESSDATITRVGRGRLTGKPLTQRALEVVKRVYARTEGAYPIIGVGGIMSVKDAQAMFEAGASLIQLYSGFVYEGPKLVKDICKAMVSTPVAKDQKEK
ncbi:MAG: quinone-dependent dihydroorotate dehydrogenase [Rikenellaceae bacterium]